MSSKTSTQQGRRTPLSLSGIVTKSHTSKGANSTTNSSGSESTGGTTPNGNKQDNKFQQQINSENADIKETSKRQHAQNEKKQQQNEGKKPSEKNQNGVNTNKQQHSNENKQQNQSKEKIQPQNGNDGSKINERYKKEKLEKVDKLDKKLDKSDKAVEKSEKDDKKVEHDKPENRDEKKIKEIVEIKEDKEKESKICGEAEKQHTKKEDVKKSKDEIQFENPDKKNEGKIEKMDVAEEHTPKKTTAIPVTPKSQNKGNKAYIPVNKTPTKVNENEKTPQKAGSVMTTSITRRHETTTITDSDFDMEPLTIESSPIRSSQPKEQDTTNISPSATSTPGKILLAKLNLAASKSDVQLPMQKGFSPQRIRNFSQISGRKSIRQLSDYTPSKFQSDRQFRESYRRINTELDVTNTSMNVTVGSEAPSNFSFSFFGRGRKRDHTPPQTYQSAIGELKTDIEMSPPKRARIEKHGFFSVVSSPLTLLRNRFSKASLESSTPVKLEMKEDIAEDEIEVQNVSGVSVHEEIDKSDKEPTETTTVAEDNEVNLKEDIVTPVETDSVSNESKDDPCIKNYEKPEAGLQLSVGEPMVKNKRCAVM